ncbi:PmoA family protein [Bacteroidota bacterium]
MKFSPLILILALLQYSCTNNDLLTFTVSAEEYSYLECPVSLDLSMTELDNYNEIELFEETENGELKIPFQIERSGLKPLLWFNLEGELLSGETRSYFIRTASPEDDTTSNSIRIVETQDEYQILDQNRSILNYRKMEMLPPEGVDSLYKRSGYIHPLWSPGGEILTRIQPPDHYHHYGIWNPWTKTHINGREIDYWNLAKGQGTVRYAGLYFIEEGSLFCKLGVKQEHVDFGSGVSERVNMEEDLHCTYRGAHRAESRYILDKSMSYRNILSDTIIFDAYRYGGGIGFRATEKWKSENCTVLTSEGKTRLEADGTKARWCIVEGESSVDGGRSGILFMSHPDNREHPEPMRVWPLDTNNGEMFFEFCPIRHNEWLILPGKDYTLDYRMVVFDGIMTIEEAEMYWNGFAYPPAVVVK